MNKKQEPQMAQIAQIKGFFIREIRVIRGQERETKNGNDS